MRRFIAPLILLSCAAFAADPIVLVTLDTVRADRLSLYGYAPKTSPNLDAAGAKALVFDQAYTIVPLTFPAHLAILAGRTPFDTGIFLNGQQFTPDAGYLPTLLKKKGYATAAFLSSAILDRTFGAAKDFDHYDDTMTRKTGGDVDAERTGAETVAAALAWLKTAKRPFFLWVHLFDPHAPYTPAQPWAGRFAHPYDAEIAQMDAALGDLFRALPRDARVLVAADHGEMLGEWGEEEHGVLLYQPAVHIPLMVWGPGIKAGRERRPVTLLDAYPTLLAFAGLKPPAGIPGVNLLALPEGEREVLATSLYGREVLGFLPSLALLREGHKLLAYGDRDYKLFNLADDPGEKENLFLTDRRRVREMRRGLQAVEFPSTLQVALRDEDKKKLTALGYSTPKKTEKLIHPEEGLKYEAMFAEAKRLMASGREEEGEMRLLTVLERAPHMTEARSFLGKHYMKTGRHAQAREIFAGMINEQAMDPRVRVNFAQSLIGQGELDKAAAELKVALAMDPRVPEAYGLLGQLLLDRRDYDALDGLYAQARQYSIESAPLFAALGMMERDRKNPAGAERHFRDALEVDPGAMMALKGLASILRSSRPREALALCLKGRERAPRDPEFNYLAGVLLFQLDGDRVAAKRCLETALLGCGPLGFCDRVNEEIRKIDGSR
jgi:arylsulfatase A-like enzyme/Flp pilus assembly protein TadD